MLALVETRRSEVVELCRRFHVRRLELFGSATSNRFNPETSDLDFLVEFEPLQPRAYADAWFGLLEGLEKLFGRHIDLVSSRIENPYLAANIEATKQTLYAA